MNPGATLPIGIFDSGIGGLTVVRQIHRLLPQEDLVYLGDTARVPYGTKSPSTVIRFALEDMQFLQQQQVKAVVVACNTVSAWAIGNLQQKFSIPVWGVIEPGVEAGLAQTKNHRIGIIGTAATIRSRAYDRAIMLRDADAEIHVQPCPLLVPLVEEGWTHHPVTLAILREYLEPLLRKRIDTLVLGCTHYPLLKRAIRTVTGKEIALVDSARSCALYVRERLAKAGLLNQSGRGAGRIQPYVTDETNQFDSLAPRFLGLKTEPAWKVALPSVG